MSSALKPVLTPAGSQNPAVPAQMNKPMHPQGGTGPYGQQMPQNLINIPHNNPNPAHNISHNPSGHQNHYSLNIPNSYAGNPQASSHPVTSSHPIANQAHVQPVSYSPPKSQVFSQSYQMQHNSNIPTTQSLPATQAQSTPEPEKPQSNGTADPKVNKPDQNHILTPKKEVLQSPEKAKTSPDKPASSSSESKPAEPKPIIEPAEVPQNVAVSPPATASTTTASLPSVPVSSATPTKDPPTASAPTNTTPSGSTSSLPPTSAAQPKTEPSVAATVESSTPASASSPTSSATTSSTTSSPPKPSDVLVPADPAPEEEEEEEEEDDEDEEEEEEERPAEPQEAQSTTPEVPVVTPPKPKEQSTAPKSPMKVATTPRTPMRKSKTPKSDQESPKSSKISVASDSKPSSSKSPGGGKTKRARIRTQPYQSPLPELEIISKMTSTSTPKSKNTDEKLIIFYKNEFLAVRNSEGGFYVCQAVQNVYKSSPKIRIRWLSQEKGEKTGEIYTPDFYDYTDFDCILTNLNLERVDKGKYRLPAKEKDRTDNILKRAIAVEKGEATSLDDSLTEDNPDGLDVSLYKDEEQLKKRKGSKRKASKSGKSPARSPSTKRSPENPKVRKVIPKSPYPKSPRRVLTSRSTPTNETKRTPAVSVGRAERAKRRNAQDPPATKSSPIVDQKKAKVLAKVVKRTIVPSPKTPATPAKSNTKSSKQPVPSTSKAKPAAKPTPTPPSRRTKRTKK